MTPRIKELQNRDIPEEEEDPQLDEVPFENMIENLEELDIVEEDEL